MTDPDTTTSRDFVRSMIARDLETGKHGGRVVTRFPPEPNGYLHVGHSKSICLNFGIGQEYEGATCNLRFDDTNPLTESPEYVESIQKDIRWLGFNWENRLFFASDYFEPLYEKAEELIEKGLAYVDSQSEDEIRSTRGTIKEPGAESPDRNRPVEENLDLFRRMRAGEFADGALVLRAKIDMAHPNMKMRDPLLYRIRHAHHHRTGDTWCIYPFYDFTHCLSDAFEGITHSLCTLEFENNREIYDWVLDHVDTEYRPQQTEFARLKLNYTVLSKRRLLELVEDGHVDGWGDPRMPTISGLRRRGYTPEAIRSFCTRIGVSKANSVVDIAQLEHAIRDDLNHRAPRVMAVLRPLKVVIENYPEGESEELEASLWPHDVPNEGTRRVPFSRELYIERDDFMESPPKRFHRLAPGREVRLRYAYFVRCVDIVKNDHGEVVELRCTYDPETRGGSAPDGRKVRGTLHWVSAPHAVDAEIRLYDRLFSDERPDRGKGGPDFGQFLNPSSLEVLRGKLEPSLAAAEPGSRFQFERQGYFYLEPEQTAATGAAVWNRIVTLRDTWAKVSAAAPPRPPKPSKPTADESEPAKDPFDTLGEAARALADGYIRGHQLARSDAALIASDPDIATFFEASLQTHDNPQATANWIVNELLRVLKEHPLPSLPFGPTELGQLVALVDDGSLSTSAAKEVFEALVAEGGSPEAIVDQRGLRQLADEDELAAIVARVVASHPGEVAAYREGKAALLGFFVGQVMKATRGTADPKLSRDLLSRALGSQS